MVTTSTPSSPQTGHGSLPARAHLASYQVRPLSEADFEAMIEVMGQAFGETLSPERVALERERSEFDRFLGAVEGAAVVGLAGAFSLTMTVPGGPRPVAGVTGVAVLPTHRRRGVLTVLMRKQLHGVYETGHEAAAALWASEPAIYGRFGYGLAARHLHLQVARSPRALLDVPADPGLRLRLVPAADSPALTEPVLRQVGSTRPGMFARDPLVARLAVLDPVSERGGRSELRCVLAHDDGGVRGYARYAVEHDPTAPAVAATVHVREAVALDPAATAALWRFLFDLDLTARVEVRHRPLDDPLLDLLVDARRASPRLTDSLYVRLVDLPRALTERAYPAPVDLVVEVRDELCPWNAGRWHLQGGPEGASCERTGRPADLACTATELGAVYLGGGSISRLAAAGRVQERRPGAAAEATRAFGWDPQPWCVDVF